MTQQKKEELKERLKIEPIGDALIAFEEFQVSIGGCIYAGTFEDLDEVLESYSPSQILRMLSGMNIGEYAIFDKSKNVLTKATETDLRAYMAAAVDGK